MPTLDETLTRALRAATPDRDPVSTSDMPITSPATASSTNRLASTVVIQCIASRHPVDRRGRRDVRNTAQR